jgi:hypothetical protein
MIRDFACSPGMTANEPARSGSDAHIVTKPIPLQPIVPPPTSRSRHAFAMADNPDAAIMEDALVDQGLRSRNNNSQSHPKAPVFRPQSDDQAGATSAGFENDHENAPLLSPTDRDYGSADSNDEGSSGFEWPGEADFAGLPWWKRPSVCA